MARRSQGPRAARAASLEGEARAYGRFGEAWVEAPEGRFLVAGAVPGDRVAFTPEAGSKPPRGRLGALLAPSPDWVEPACALAARCGGCPLIFASAALEARTKLAMLEGALAGLPGAEALAPTLEAPGPALGYRRRVRLGFVGGRAPRLGYRLRRSHALLDLPACPVLEPSLEAALPLLRARLLPSLPAAGGSLRLAKGQGSAPVAVVEVSGPLAPEAYEAAAALVAEGALAGVALCAGEGLAPALFGHPEEQVEGPSGLQLRSAPGGFAQANDAVNRALVAQAVALAEAEGASVLELYAGAGNLSLPLARVAGRLVTLERSAEATAAARDNLAAHGLRAELLTREASALPRGRFDVVVLDPPRAGAAEALPGVLAARPARIVYVSCDPSTLRRDLRVLTEGGYRVDQASAYDMFPQTAHVESLVRLVRAG